MSKGNRSWISLITHFLLAGVCLISMMSSQALPYVDNPIQIAFKSQSSKQLQQAEQYLDNHQPLEAKKILQKIDPQQLSSTEKNEKYLLDANLALTLGKANQSLNLLSKISHAEELPTKQKVTYYQLVGMAYRDVGDFYQAALSHMQLTHLLGASSTANDYIQQTWQDVQQLSPEELQDHNHQARTQLVKGWMQLGLLFSYYGANASELNSALSQWQQHFPNHPANAVVTQEGYAPTTEKSANHIALLLPLTGPLASSGNAIKNGFMTAYYNAQKQQDKTQNISIYDTNNQNIHQLYEQAANDGATMIVGPLTKDNLSSLAQSHDLDIPTLALNYTPYTTSNLFQFALSPRNEAQLVAQRAIEDNKRHVAIVAPDSPWAQGIVQAFVQVFQEQGGTVVINSTYSNKTNLNHMVSQLLHISASEQRKKKLEKTLHQKINTIPRRRQDVDMLFLVSTPSQARRIRPLFKFYYAGDLPIYSTSVVYSGKHDSLKDQDLNGIEFCDMPWSLSSNDEITNIKQQMHELMSKPNSSAIRLFAFGYDAYTLASELPHITPSASTSVPGLTGALYLSNQQRFYRQLQWAQFEDGLPKLLTP